MLKIRKNDPDVDHLIENHLKKFDEYDNLYIESTNDPFGRIVMISSKELQTSSIKLTINHDIDHYLITDVHEWVIRRTSKKIRALQQLLNEVKPIKYKVTGLNESADSLDTVFTVHNRDYYIEYSVGTDLFRAAVNLNRPYHSDDETVIVTSRSVISSSENHIDNAAEVFRLLDGVIKLQN